MAAQALAQGGAAAATYAVNSSIHEAFHRGETPAPASFSGWSLLTATAGGAATPVLGGFFSRLYQEALNPKTGWVWHPNARAWDAFYQELVMGLGQMVIQHSFGSPRHNSPKPEQRSQPIPPAVLEDPVDEKADLAAQAAQFEGSQEIVPAKNYIQTLLEDWQKPGINRVWDASGREYQYELDADGAVISFTDVTYGVTTIPEVIQVTAPPPPASMVPSPSGYSFVPDRAYPELFDWLRARDLFHLKRPSTVELISKYENERRDIEFLVATGQVAGDQARRPLLLQNSSAGKFTISGIRFCLEKSPQQDRRSTSTAKPKKNELGKSPKLRIAALMMSVITGQSVFLGPLTKRLGA